MTRLWKSELKDAINNYGPIVALDRFRIEGQKCDIKGLSISKKRYGVLNSSKNKANEAHYPEVSFSSCQRNLIKNISDWSYSTDHKNGNDFFMSLFKWPKIAVKKSQIF